MGHRLITIDVHLKFVVIYTSLSLYQPHLEAFSFNTSRIMDSIMLGRQQKNYYSFTTCQIILPPVHHNLQFKKNLKTHMGGGRLIQNCKCLSCPKRTFINYISIFLYMPTGLIFYWHSRSIITGTYSFSIDNYKFVQIRCINTFRCFQDIQSWNTPL